MGQIVEGGDKLVAVARPVLLRSSRASGRRENTTLGPGGPAGFGGAVRSVDDGNRVQAAFIQFQRGLDILDMHRESVLDGFGLAAQMIAP